MCLYRAALDAEIGGGIPVASVSAARSCVIGVPCECTEQGKCIGVQARDRFSAFMAFGARLLELVQRHIPTSPLSGCQDLMRAFGLRALLVNTISANGTNVQRRVEIAEVACRSVSELQSFMCAWESLTRRHLATCRRCRLVRWLNCEHGRLLGLWVRAKLRGLVPCPGSGFDGGCLPWGNSRRGCTTGLALAINNLVGKLPTE